MRGQCAALATGETGSLVIQVCVVPSTYLIFLILLLETMFENMDEDKARIVNEVLDGLPKVALNQWGAFVIQHSRRSSLSYVMHWLRPLYSYRARYRQHTLTLLLDQLPLYASDDVGIKSLLKLVKPADPDVVSQVIDKMCQTNSAAHHRRAIIVDLALSVNGNQLIQHILPMVRFGNGKGVSTDLASGKQGAAHALVQQHQGTCGYSSRLPHGVACDMAIRPVKWPVRSTRFALTSAHNPQYERVLWLLDLRPSPDS